MASTRVRHPFALAWRPRQWLQSPGSVSGRKITCNAFVWSSKAEVFLDGGVPERPCRPTSVAGARAPRLSIEPAALKLQRQGCDVAP